MKNVLAVLIMHQSHIITHRDARLGWTHGLRGHGHDHGDFSRAADGAAFGRIRWGGPVPGLRREVAHLVAAPVVPNQATG